LEPNRERTGKAIEGGREELRRAREQRQRINDTLSDSDRATSAYRKILRRAGLLK
jgi:hypothetical protein